VDDDGAGHPEINRLDPPRWHHASIQLRHLAAQLASEGAELNGVLLDLGCGARPYGSLFPSVRYLGADVLYTHGRPDLIAMAEALPISTGSVDVVLSTQQLEHVISPDQVLREAARVLRRGGRLLLSTHGVWVHHPDPTDRWRWTEEGLCALIAANGFTIDRTHRQGEVVAAAGVLLTYPFSVRAVRAKHGGWLLRGALSGVQRVVGRLDRVAARRLPRHYASPSYLVVATRAGR
jgi:SAM-dependent methyltransferase